MQLRVFRPMIEFFTDCIAQFAPGFLAGSHVHEAIARARAATPSEVEAEETEGLLPEVDQPGFRFIQRQPLGLHIYPLYHWPNYRGGKDRGDLQSLRRGNRWP